MARKAVLEGGKREEIVNAALKLFMEHGYEGTSVRDILRETGGEVGMLYHYFRSKEELFDAAIDSYFKNYAREFEELTEGMVSPEETIERIMEHYRQGGSGYESLRKNVHPSVEYMLYQRTLREMRGAVIKLLERQSQGKAFDSGRLPPDIAAGQLIAGFSATIHADSFKKMSVDEQMEILLKFVRSYL